MSQIISDLAILLATAGAIVATLDFFLDKNEKTKLGNAILSLWYHISAVSWNRTIQLYRSEEFFRQALLYLSPLTVILTGGLALFELIIEIVLAGANVMLMVLAVVLFGGVFILCSAGIFYAVNLAIYRNPRSFRFAKKIYFWSVKGTKALVLGKGLVCLLVVAVISFILEIPDRIFSESLHNFPFFRLVGGFIVLPFICGFAVSSILVTRVIASALISIPVWCLERVLRRISEYEKGPILGISVFLAAIGLMLKTL